MAKHEQPQQYSEGPPYFREWREWAGLSGERLAKKMGISGAQISKQETHRRKRVSIDFLEKFALAVGCNPWDPLAGKPGILPQIDDLVRRLDLDDQDMILRIVKQFVDRAG